MKSLHRPDLFGWSAFDEARNVDFNGVLWTRPGGNVAFDPMPVSEHDLAHVDDLGGVAWILITNADHVRAATTLAERFGARILAPGGDRHLPELASLPVETWMRGDDTLPCGVLCIAMEGSKTPGELAFLMPGGDTVIVGDLVRGQRAGSLNLLPPGKLADPAAAGRSVARLAALPDLQAALVGDGQSIFRDASRRLAELVEVIA